MAYGPAMETFIALLLFVFLMFVIVAYMVLLRDIWTPLVGLLPGFHDPNGNIVLVILLLLLIPFLVQNSLHSLRYNCYIGFASVSILCVALCHHGIFRLSTNDLTNEASLSSHLLIATKSWSDILFSFPIIMLSFLSHFNVLPIQSALICPTRSRMSRVIHWSVSGCFVLMYLFGLGGYMFAGSGTQGNILLNVTLQDDWMFLMGRIGCGLTSKYHYGEPSACRRTTHDNDCSESLLRTSDEGSVDGSSGLEIIAQCLLVRHVLLTRDTLLNY